MKRYYLIILFALLASTCAPKPSIAQATEIQQLLLNIEKLSELKKILNNMYKAYKIISGGYDRIKDISEGNFKLHKVFLDGLWVVNPSIKKYKRVADIIELQGRIVKEYKTNFNRFKHGGSFNLDEINYLSAVYKNLINASLKNLDELFLVITANKLRMNDEERINTIDRIFTDVQDKLTFLRNFNNNTSLLAIQRAKEKNDAQVLGQLHDVMK
jgi:hypothetical protein